MKIIQFITIYIHQISVYIHESIDDYNRGLRRLNTITTRTNAEKADAIANEATDTFKQPTTSWDPMTAMTSPYLCVHNGLKLWHISSAIMYHEDIVELCDVSSRPCPLENFPHGNQPGQRRGAAHGWLSLNT
ncbi:hypothetical protein F5B21DRAFT_522700 [Xylaria acuta]|nr:hypothetical protein F5B21DRAFT_522700 [Xylaria acuta]